MKKIFSRRAAKSSTDYFFLAVFFLADFLTAFFADFLAAFFLATLRPPLKKPGELVSLSRREGEIQQADFSITQAMVDAALTLNKKPTSYRLPHR